MEKNCLRVVTNEDIRRFRQQLFQYEMCNLRILYNYFWNDLKHIVEILDTQNLLSELTSRNIPMRQNYLLLEKEFGASVLSEFLIQDIMDIGRDAVLALWESLFVLQNNYQHPNLIGVLAEFRQTGPTLVPLIKLDEYGHQLLQLNDAFIILSVVYMPFYVNLSQFGENVVFYMSIGVIVVSLVRQSLLKGSSILFTSRPTKLASVDISVFQRVSEIMGFFPKERELYFAQFFHDHKLSAKAFQYVRENDALYTFCYIPSYCWIVCKVLSMCLKASSINDDQQISILPKTVTQLFVSYVANTLLNHCVDTECPGELMKSIGRMAEHGIMNHILTFDTKDLEIFQVDITSKLLSSFIIETYQSKSHTATFSFLHLTIQEFFSALHHYLIFSEMDLQSSLHKARLFEDGRGEMFLRFLCGLSDGITISLLKPYLRCKTSASEQVIRWLSQETATQWGPKTDPREKMNILTYLFESRNKPLVYSTIGPHGQLDFSEFHLTPVDCTVLAFILESCKETDCLNLDRCFIQSEGLERLTGILHTVQKLRLSNNDLKDSDMQLIYKVLTHNTSRVQKLSLRKNSLTSTSCCSLAVALSMNQSLTELDLSRNNLAGPDFYNLMTTLSSPTCTISLLSLQQIKLMDEHAPLLTLLGENPNLTHLDLSHNFLTDASAEHIQHLILSSQNLKEIRIEVNDFTKEKEGFLQQLEALQPGLSIVV